MENIATPFMKIKQATLLLSVLVGILFLSPATSAMAGIINPGFADDDSDRIIDGWVNNEWVTSWGSGSVQFMPDYRRTINDAFLSQVFTVDSGSTTLSFDGVISVPSETGVFTAALLDAVTGNTLVPSVDGQGHFFTISSEQIPSGHDHLDFTCSLDVSGLSGQQVELVFNLNNDYPPPANLDDPPPADSYATVSNLAVPEPATMVLLGLGGLLLSRRRK